MTIDTFRQGEDDPCAGCKKPLDECNRTCEHFDPCVHECEFSLCPLGCPNCECDIPECIAARDARAKKEE